MTVVPHPPFFSLFPRLNIQLKCRHFNAIEVFEAESQAAQNIFTDHYVQDDFKNGRSAENDAYMWKGTTSRVMEVSRPKVSVDQMLHNSQKLWMAYARR
jgi:hypothetical protein